MCALPYRSAFEDVLDPGNGQELRTLGRNCQFRLKTTEAAGETRTLGRPDFLGQQILLYFETDGGDCVITVDHYINYDEDNTITHDEAGEWLEMFAIEISGQLFWRTRLSMPILKLPALTKV